MSQIYSDGMFSKAFNTFTKSTLSISELDECIRSKREALLTIPQSDVRYKIWTAILHFDCNLKYRATKDAADLDAAIEYTRAFVNLIPIHKPRRAIVLNQLGSSLEERCTRTKRIEDLQEAIAVIQEAVQMAEREGGPVVHPKTQVRNLHDLGFLFGRRYSIAGDTAYFDMARECLEQAAGMEINPRRKAKCLMTLSHRHAERYVKEGTRDCIRDSIDLMVQVAILVPESHNDAGYLHHFAIRHADRTLLDGSTLALDIAISSAERAVDLTPDPGPDRALYLNTFARALGLRSARSSTMDDLEKAIQVAREAMDLTPRDHPNRIAYMSGLKMWLVHRYNARGLISDLEDAFSLVDEIIDLTSREGKSNRGQQLDASSGDLAEAIQTFRQTIRKTLEIIHNRSDLQRAIESSHSRTGADPGHQSTSWIEMLDGSHFGADNRKRKLLISTLAVMKAAIDEEQGLAMLKFFFRIRQRAFHLRHLRERRRGRRVSQIDA
ncbi:hypothetical protein F4680DRAFT_468613 [Xylaria scruposa]|nr:hypothetical protein F4680DRAFT_468613 [Xylaria scruposa]